MTRRHKSEELELDDVAMKYYGIKGHFICPTCNTKEDDFASFKDKHGEHAGIFTKTKQMMFDEMCKKNVRKELKTKNNSEKFFVMVSKSPVEQLGCYTTNEYMKLICTMSTKKTKRRMPVVKTITSSMRKPSKPKK